MTRRKKKEENLVIFASLITRSWYSASDFSSSRKKGTALALNPKGANFIESMVSNSDGHILHDVVLISTEIFYKKTNNRVLGLLFQKIQALCLARII